MENKETYIYTLKCPKTNGIRYVGKSNNIKERYSSHLQRSKNKSNHRECWINSLLVEDTKPILEILDIIPINEWEFWEIYWISQFKAWGFNLTNSTEGGDGGVISEEVSKKLSKLNSGENNPMYGKTCKNIWVERYGIEVANEMWEEKYSTMKGKKRSEKVKKKISNTKIKKGYKHNDNTKKQIGASSKKMWDSKIDKSFSENHKMKISKANKGKKRTEKVKKEMSERSKKLWENKEYRGKVLNNPTEKQLKARKNLSEIGKKLKGIKQSEETKKKRSESLKLYWCKRKGECS